MTDSDRMPAHRPSRRDDIIDAAIVLFARKGFTDSSISGIADDAHVAVTAIYYHFSGKEELYNAAVRRVFESISARASGARNEGAQDEHSLDRVIDAVWAWIDANPDQAMLYSQLPGATPQVVQLRREFEDKHVQRSVQYLSGFDHDGRTAKADRAIDKIRTRALVDLLISVQTMRLANGPLSDESGDELRLAVKQVAKRLVSS